MNTEIREALDSVTNHRSLLAAAARGLRELLEKERENLRVESAGNSLLQVKRDAVEEATLTLIDIEEEAEDMEENCKQLRRELEEL